MSDTAPLPGPTPIEAHGVTAVAREGDRTRAVVMLHGIGSNASSFAPLMAAWPLGPLLLAWNAPGYSSSRPLANAWPVAADYAQAVASLLDAHDLQSVDLVGHSMGCLISAAFARTYPERVRHLALLSPALGYSVAPSTTLPPAIAARITDLEDLGAARFAETRAARLICQPERKPAVLTAVRAAMAQVKLPGYAQAVRMLASGDLLTDVATLRMPIVIANGTDDLVTPKAGAERLQAACPHAQLILVPDTGHALPQEAPKMIAHVLSEAFGGSA